MALLGHGRFARGGVNVVLYATLTADEASIAHAYHAMLKSEMSYLYAKQALTRSRRALHKIDPSAVERIDKALVRLHRIRMLVG